MEFNKQKLCYTLLIIFVTSCFIMTYLCRTFWRDDNTPVFINILGQYGEFHPVSTNLTDYDQIMQRRLEAVNKQCQRSPHLKSEEPHSVFYQYGHMNYCLLPKVGMTYWKRVMRFISHDYPPNPNILKPSDIDRKVVHGGLSKIKQFPVSYYPKYKERKKNDVAFMFIRNPYSRLWSNYLDKFFLPDFWQQTYKLSVASKQEITPEQLKCGNYLTFTGFLTAIVNIWPQQLEFHWEPAHRLCGPCLMKYDMIGRMENFANDSKYVLEKFGFQQLQEIASKRDLAFEEIETLTQYNFNLFNWKKHLPGCLTIIEMAERLWKAYQYNGHIDKRITFPADEFHDIDSIEQATQILIKIAKLTINRQERDISTQKREMMISAFREVPNEILEKIKVVYKYDFEIFGYDKELFK